MKKIIVTLTALAGISTLASPSKTQLITKIDTWKSLTSSALTKVSEEVTNKIKRPDAEKMTSKRKSKNERRASAILKDFTNLKKNIIKIHKNAIYTIGNLTSKELKAVAKLIRLSEVKPVIDSTLSARILKGEAVFAEKTVVKYMELDFATLKQSGILQNQISQMIPILSSSQDKAFDAEKITRQFIALTYISLPKGVSEDLLTAFTDKDNKEYITNVLRPMSNFTTEVTRVMAEVNLLSKD
ncbi:hypothetical protein [Halobacteriovorax sp. ZH2_bin.1]|uniref:hypothetical protein n=1 Tax=unclassified Halobacteriovorax TaxID=2639665 RepID=UPI0037121532